MKIIAFVGMPGSGKGTCTDYLEQKGYPMVHFGNMVVEETQRRGLEVNEKSERIVREDLRATRGKAVLAELVIEKVKTFDHPELAVIDGLYSWSEYKELSRAFGEAFTVIAVFTPRALRYERVAERDYRPLTNEEAAARDVAEIENLEKGGPIARADYTLINDSTQEALLSQVDELITRITQ